MQVPLTDIWCNGACPEPMCGKVLETRLRLALREFKPQGLSDEAIETALVNPEHIVYLVDPTLCVCVICSLNHSSTTCIGCSGNLRLAFICSTETRSPNSRKRFEAITSELQLPWLRIGTLRFSTAANVLVCLPYNGGDMWTCRQFTCWTTTRTIALCEAVR